MKVNFTHKGWFGLCPIYIADAQTDGPRIEPRIPMTGWLIHLSSAIYVYLLGAEYFPIKFTGELDPPKLIEMGEDA